MDILQTTKYLCKSNNIIPARSKGQNFLIKEEVYDKIIAAADLHSNDTVLEVGPGLGFLTAKLALRLRSGQAQNAGRVIAVELDDKLAGLLKTRLAKENVENVEVVNANILDLKLETHNLKLETHNLKSEIEENKSFKFQVSSFKVVANLPYNITSVFLRKFLSAEQKPSLMVLMLQKEVAKRICAKPGDMSLLAVSVQFYSQPEIVEYVPANAFWPQPKVDSAIVTIRDMRFEIRDVGVDKERDFFRMVKFGFSARRKMLKNNLAGGYHIGHDKAENYLKLANLNLTIRAQELSMAQWLKLFDVIKENML